MKKTLKELRDHKKSNLNESSFANLFAYVVGNQLLEYK